MGCDVETTFSGACAATSEGKVISFGNRGIFVSNSELPSKCSMFCIFDIKARFNPINFLRSVDCFVLYFAA